jgi:esterase
MSFLNQFKHEISGNPAGPKLVFLHGVMGAGSNWRRILPAFQKNYHILVYDQRGHGWSMKPEGEHEYTPEKYAEDLAQILAELKWTKTTVVGHSMGGRNALLFAKNHPEMLDLLVIEDIGPEGNPSAMKNTMALVTAVPTPFDSKDAAKNFFTYDFPKTNEQLKNAKVLGQFFFTNIEQKPNGQYDWRFSKDAIFKSLLSGHFKPRWEIIENLKVPTLFVRGELSDDFPRAEFEKVLSKNMLCEGVEISGTGHWVHFEEPEQFIHVLENFFIKHHVQRR